MRKFIQYSFAGRYKVVSAIIRIVIRIAITVVVLPVNLSFSVEYLKKKKNYSEFFLMSNEVQ